MKKMGYSKRIASAFLAVILALTTALSQPIDSFAARKINGYVDHVDGDVIRVVKQQSYTLVPGVTETDIVLNDQTGKAQVKAFLTTIEPGSDVSLKATYAGYYDEGNYNNTTKESKWQVGDWDLTTTTHQAKAYEKATGENVIFATNGDYFNMQTGQPRGSLYINGNCLNPEKDNDEPYFAVLKDGSYVIRDAGTDKSDVLEAVSGPFHLVKDGKNVVPGESSLFPVNSVGFMEDGSVFFFMADGRQYPNSVGMTINEQADFLVAQGVKEAIYLDGGGSATVITRREGEKTFKIRNNPSDGSERTISSGFLLVANSLSDGVFHHASVAPNGESYTPGSTVAFTAQGVDKTGSAAEMPKSGLSWALATDSADKGTIDANTGSFVSNGTLGEVTAELYYKGEKVGESTVKITEPDDIYFSSTSVSLDFGERSTLGLEVRSENAEIFYKNGDFDWSIEAVNPGVAESSLGYMDGNTFVAGNANSSMNALITVRYTRKDGTVLSSSIIAEIGKMPVVAFDFEPTENGPQKGAHFHWGKSTYVDAGVTPGYYGDYPELTVPALHTYQDAETEYRTLSAPYRFTGNFETSVPAAEIFKANGYSFYLWPNNSITHFSAGNVTTTSAANGGQVRFGEYSMELNYDYASYDGSSNSNYYIRNCSGEYYVEGQPTELGVWVYADAETYNLAGYSLHADLAVYTGSGYSGKNLSLVHDDVDANGNLVQSSAINWVGWKYCYANLSALASYYSPEHPYLVRNGEGMIWLSFQPASGGGRYSGTFYFDNYRFVYGTNLDDLDNPYFKSLTVNNESIFNKSDVTVDSNNVEISASFADVNGKNATGIDATRTTFKIDGQEVTCDGDENSATTRLELANGLHSVSVTVYDKFGNTNTVSSYVTVSDGEAVESAILTGEDTVVLGSDYKLSLVTKGSISDVDMTVLQLNSDFGEPVVTAAEGWDVEAVYASTGFKKAKMEIKAKWAGDGEAPADAEVATLSFNVPTNLDAAIDFFTYQVTKVTCVTTSGKVVSSAQQKVVLTLSAYYTVIADVAVSGQNTLLTVVNPEGEPEADVEIYINGTLVGLTDADGQFVTNVTTVLPANTTFKVSAKKGDLVSFETTVIVMASVANEEGKPEGLMHTASRNGDTEQVITWFASCVASENAAIVEYSENSDLSNAVTVTGDSTLHAFATSKDAAYINTVTLTGLEGGKTYYYRAGDGKTWSDVSSFKTTAKDAEVSFFVVGDTQMHGNRSTDAEEIQLLKNLGIQVAGSDFGIQTGDYVDNGGNYKMWEEMDATFTEAFGEADVIHVLGNHEYYGDADGVVASAIYGLASNEQDYYSVEYGNVYVAVINYSASLKEACEWLVEDAKASNAQWKFLTVHQPAYYTNVNGGSQRFHASIPAAAEEAGINAVFSGHDHSYARTLPLTSGEVDEENGVVYFICGDLGEKSRNINYAANNNPAFHFGCIDQSYDAISIKVTATEDKLTFKTIDSQGNILDSYTVESECSKNGHSYIYDGTKLVCEHCHKEADVATYVGFAKDAKTGKKMYLYLGTVKTGLVETSDGEYIFDENGLALDGEYTIERMKYVLENGKVVDKNGFVNVYSKRFKKYYLRMYIRGELVQKTGWYCLDGTWYYVEETDVYCGGCKTLDGVCYKFNADGSHTVGTFKTNKGNTKYYFAGKLVKGLTEIEGKTYYFNTSNGVMVVNKQMTIGNLVYTFGPEGYATSITEKPVKPSTGFWKEGGYTYYYVDGVAVKSAWVEVDEKQYYFDANGHMVTKQTVIDNALCTFNADGSLKSKESLDTYNGFITISGSTYFYVDGAKAKGWKNIEGDWYYFLTDTGVMVKASKTIDGVFYKFASNGKLQGGTYKTTSKGTRYYVAGKYVTGKYEIDGSNYYFDKNGYMVKSKTVTSGNVIYTIDENGVIVKEEAKPTRPSTGFWTEGGHTYYYVDDVKVVSAWVEADGKQYYFDADGYMVTKQTVIDNALCSFNADGSLASKEALDTYNGFLTLGSKTYFYENGVAVKGWKNISENWYYFNADGNMNKSNKTIDGVFYTFHSDGTLKSGAWKTNKNGSRYYYAGTYLKGLQTVDGIIRYFNKSNGYMVTNATVEVKGVTYIFDENGVGSVYVEPEVEEPTTEEPTTEEPKAEEPTTEEPKAEEPVAEEPAAEEPVAEEPIVEDPVVENPEEAQVNDAE